LKPRSKILIIAGSDSSGGAGIQADIKTITALGSYAMTAITAVTAQNTTGVNSIASISPKEIFKQIVFTCKDIKPDAIKIGMLHSPSVIRAVILALKKIVEAGYDRAKKVLTEKIDDLHKIAKALLVYETLTGDEIRDLMLKNIQPKKLNEIKDDKDKQESSALGSLGLKPKLAH